MTKKRKSFWTPLRVILSVLFILVIVGLGLWFYLQGKDVAVLNPQGVVGAHEKNLIIFTVLLSAIVVVPVFVMLFTFAWRYREGNHGAKYTPDVAGNRLIEAVWWGIPIVIIGILCVVTWVSTHQLDPYKSLASNVKPLRVQVVALQWKWLFIYPDQHIASVNQFKFPAGTPVNFEISSDAPMSAFWIPALGTQVYAMNGMTSQLSLMADHPGTYRGTNSNINGKGYSGMTFDAIALSTRHDFDSWARSLGTSKSLSSLDWKSYQNLAKPSEKNKPAYYHLNDDNLYTEIVDKYMSGGSMVMNEHNGSGH